MAARASAAPLPWAIRIVLAVSVGLVLTACQGKALVINDQVIGAHELDRRLALSRMVAADATDEGLDQVINQVLLLQEAHRRGLRVSADDVERSLARLEQEAGGRAALVANLRRFGLTLHDLRRDLRERALILAMTAQLTAGITVSAREVEDYFAANRAQFRQPDEVRLAYFVLPDATTAQRAADALVQGTPLEEIGTALELRGPFAGDVGYVAPAQILPPMVREALAAASVGDVVGPIEEQGRWHVVQSRDVRPGRNPTLAEVEGDLREFLHQLKSKNAVAAEVAELRQTASIHWRGQ